MKNIENILMNTGKIKYLDIKSYQKLYCIIKKDM